MYFNGFRPIFTTPERVIVITTTSFLALVMYFSWTTWLNHGRIFEGILGGIAIPFGIGVVLLFLVAMFG